MEEVYLIPGLGADHRVFQYLDLSEYVCHHVSWVDPAAHETIEQYAGRLAEQIKSPDPILIGVSFGGVIAIEIAKQIKTGKVILISSARTHAEVPLYFKWLGKLGFQTVIPSTWWKAPNRVLFYFFGTRTKEERKLLFEIVRDTDPKFLKWQSAKSSAGRMKSFLVIQF